MFPGPQPNSTSAAKPTEGNIVSAGLKPGPPRRSEISTRGAMTLGLSSRVGDSPNWHRQCLLVRPTGTLRVSAVAIARHVFRQSFPGNLDPHPRGVADGPAVFAIRLGLV